MNPHTLICHSAQDGTPANKQGHGCDFCSSKGMAILPVRYAPISKLTGTDTGVPSIPAPPGHAWLKSHDYTLRLLRSGYLYLFDEATQRIGAWQITPDAKFRLFAIDETDSSGVPDIKRKCGRSEESNEPFKCKDASHHVIASMIHWPAKRGTTLWLHYSELPMPATALRKQLTKAPWRTLHMQSLTVGANSDHAYPAARIPALLAEHNCPHQALFDPHPYQRDAALGGDIGKAFITHMEKVQHRTGTSGVMLALNDDIGFMEALNYDRQQPEKIFGKTVGHAPEKKDEAECTASELETRRKLACYSMFNMLLDQKTAEIKAKAQSNDETYKTIAESTKSPYASGYESMGLLWLDTPEQSRAKEAKRISDAHADIIDNFAQYVDSDAFFAFKRDYENAVQVRDTQLMQMDRDYATYVVHRSPLVVEAYAWMQHHVELAAAFMEITFRCLVGNVITEHSESLWYEHLLKVDSKNLLTASLGLHNPQLISLLTDKLKTDDASFASELLKISNVNKFAKALNTLIAKNCKSLTDETIFALLGKGIDKVASMGATDVFKAINQSVSAASLELVKAAQNIRSAWVHILARIENMRLRIAGQTFRRIAELSLSASQYSAFMRELPQHFKAHYERNEMHTVADVQDKHGNTSTIRHQPVTEISPGKNEAIVKVYLLVEDSNIKSLKTFEHSASGDSVKVRFIDTNEQFSIKSKASSEPVVHSLSNINKQDIQQGFHSSISLFFAGYSLYTAILKDNNNLADINSLISSFLGAASATAAFIDTGRAAMVSTEEVGKLRLLSATPLLQKVSMASNILGIVSAVLDVLKAVEAYLNGEPGMVVVWMGASATISAISGILAFYALNAWWSFGITLVLAVITIALAILTMQELTLPQRLWVHRSVFGRPNHNYYNSIPFGGDKPRSLPNDPAAADEWKDYQRRALNEEAQALGMLVTGITLEVNVYKANPVGKAGEAYDCMQRMNGVPISIKLSIPESLNGQIQLELKDNVASLELPSAHKGFQLKFKKTGKDINILDEKEDKYIIDNDFICKSGMCIKEIERCISYGERAVLQFSLFSEENQSIAIAGDKVKVEG